MSDFPTWGLPDDGRDHKLTQVRITRGLAKHQIVVEFYEGDILIHKVGPGTLEPGATLTLQMPGSD